MSEEAVEVEEKEVDQGATPKDTPSKEKKADKQPNGFDLDDFIKQNKEKPKQDYTEGFDQFTESEDEEPDSPADEGGEAPKEEPIPVADDITRESIKQLVSMADFGQSFYYAHMYVRNKKQERYEWPEHSKNKMSEAFAQYCARHDIKVNVGPEIAGLFALGTSVWGTHQKATEDLKKINAQKKRETQSEDDHWKHPEQPPQAWDRPKPFPPNKPRPEPTPKERELMDEMEVMRAKMMAQMKEMEKMQQEMILGKVGKIKEPKSLNVENLEPKPKSGHPLLLRHIITPDMDEDEVKAVKKDRQKYQSEKNKAEGGELCVICQENYAPKGKDCCSQKCYGKLGAMKRKQKKQKEASDE